MVLFSRLEWATHSNVEEGASGTAQKSSAPVYSVDLHPDGSRFATAGGDCRVKIWSTGGVPSPGATKAKTPLGHQHLLCSRAAHLGPINCLRWSPDGRYLATASDDKTIKVWERLAGSGSVFGGDVSIENWKDIRTLRGHSMNVMGVCWSPDGKMLASCSLDNTLAVWLVENMEQPKLLHTIEGHKGLVKGLAWDPVGKYIASQAEDRTVRVWTVGDWAEERVVKAPFKDSVATNSVFFTRLDWTPSGSNVITSCGINNGNHTAPALPRGQWEPAKDLVGHSKPVVAVRCSSRIYALDAAAAAGQAYDKLVLIVAIASTDGTLSVWSTSAQRPIAVVSGLFSQCVMDISWSEKQDLLLACSTDGTVGCIRFEEGELGVPLSREQKLDYMKNLYGDLIGTATTSALVETPDQLQLEKEAACEVLDLTGSETTTPIARHQASGTEAVPEAGPVFDIESLGSSESCDLGSLMGEEEEEEEEEEEDDDEDVDMVDHSAAATLGGSGAPPPYAGAPITNQEVQVLPGGKRRITPLFLGRPEQLGAAAVPASPFASPGIAASAAPAPAASPVATTEAAAALTSTSASVGKKRQRATSNAEGDEGEPPKGKAKTGKAAAKTTVTKKAPTKKAAPRAKKEPGQTKKRLTPTLVSDNLAAPSPPFQTPRARPRTPSKQRGDVTPSARMVAMTVGKEKFVLKEPDSQESLKFQLPARPRLLGEEGGPPAVLNTVASPSSRSGKAGAVLKCSKEGILQWEQFLPAEASILTGNADFCAVACKNGTIHVFSPAGRRLLPAIALGHPLTAMVCNKYGHLTAITCGCLLYVWNILKGSCEVMESVRPVLAGAGDCIRRVTVTQNAQPVIVTGVGSCYTLDPKMRAWLLVADGSFSQSCYNGSVSGSKPGPLAQLHQETEKATGPPSFSNSRQDLESLSHLGYQVAAAKALDSKVEYKHWLITYVRRLSVEAEEGILRELCDELLEPEVAGAAPGDATRQVLGLDKRSLLDVVLRTMSTNRKLQRVVNKYRELLKELEPPKKSDTTMEVDVA